jgi:hypothetical protein
VRRAAAAALLALACARLALAQGATNRAASYLVASDVSDARALWVNPAGLAARPEASVLLDLTVVQPGATGRLGQVTTGFNARGLSFGYQRDNSLAGIHGHTFKFGLAANYGQFAGGATLALHGGANRGTAWDLGVRYDWLSTVTMGGVIRNIGHPLIFGVRQATSLVPAVTVRPFGSVLALSAQASIVSDSSARGYTVEAEALWPRSPRVGLLARFDTDGSLHARALLFGLSIGARDRVGAVGSTPGDFSKVDAVNVYGVSSRTPR